MSDLRHGDTYDSVYRNNYSCLSMLVVETNPCIEQASRLNERENFRI